MLFSTTSLATLALFLARATALPADASVLGARSLELINTKAVQGGVITVYNDASLPLVNVTAAADLSSAPGSTLARRCGSNTIFCDYANFRARSDLCGHLMDILGSPENRDLSMTPYTSQCFTATNIATNNRCCISWSRQVTGLKVNMLFGAAAPQLSQCSRDGLVSARAIDVDLAGACVAQCLSSRPDGCAW
jgi:hypothetical protein